MSNRVAANHEHLKRLACQIVAQLPDSPEEAMMVLGYAEGILAALKAAPLPTVIVPSLRVVRELHPASGPSGR